MKDSINKPLAYANVIAKPQSSNGKLQFSITDDEGYYKLYFSKGDSITISISYLGFKTLDYSFVAIESKTVNFSLERSSEILEEIVIEPPVTVRGDTISYNTDKFVTGEERKLKNILKKLPGVEVSKNGEVTVLGKKVTKMLVDGKKFFGGNSKLAVENIPADAVDGVDVIDNYNEVSFLKNLSESDEMAMNIKLKEGKKRFVFGDVEGNVGNDSFTKIQSNLFYYSPKINLNFIGNYNNIGEKTFTYRDYLSFQSTMNPVFGSKFNWRGGNFSEFLKDKDVLESEQKFGALNLIRNSDKLNISGFLILSKTDTRNLLETQNNYSTFSEFRTNQTFSDTFSSIGRYSIEYSPKENERWLSNSELKTNNGDIDNNINSLVNEDQVDIQTMRKIQSLKVNQIFEWHKRFSEKHTISSILKYDYDKNDKNSIWRTNDDILTNLIPIISNQNILILDQVLENNKHNLGLIIKYFWEINNTNHIYLTIGDNYSRNNFETVDQQILNNGSVNNFKNDGFGNNLDFQFNDLFFGLNYKLKEGIFTFNNGFEFHHFNWDVNQSNQISRTKTVLLPSLQAKIEFNKSKKLQINYRMRSTFSDVSRFANGFYLRSYNSVFRGNENISNNLFHNASLFYSRFSLYRGLIMNARLNYSKKLRGAQNTVSFDGVNQFLTSQMFNDPEESVQLRGSIYKKIRNVRYKFDGTASHSNFIQQINTTFDRNKNRKYSYSLGLETLYENFPTIDIGFKKSIGNFTSSNSISRFVTNEPFITVDHDFWKGFVMSFDYRLYDYTNEVLNQKNRFEIANVDLSYRKKNSPWTFRIFSNNLFNTSFKRNNQFSQYVISDTRTFILPRVIMIGIGYNL